MRRRLAPLVLAVLLLAGCSSEVTTSGFDVTEFTITGPERVAPGTHVFDVSNSGEYPHTMVVTDSSGQVVAATGLIAPGETTTLEVDLDPGVYSFTCRIVAEDGEGHLVDHFESGMHASVTVGD